MEKNQFYTEEVYIEIKEELDRIVKELIGNYGI